jgi:hypothetical protein
MGRRSERSIEADRLGFRRVAKDWPAWLDLLE